MKTFLIVLLLLVGLACITTGSLHLNWGDDGMRILGQIVARDGFEFRAYRDVECNREIPRPDCGRHLDCPARMMIPPVPIPPPEPTVIHWTLRTPEGVTFRHEAGSLHDARDMARTVTQGRFRIDN